MTIPLDITVRDIEMTPAIDERIRQKAEKLSQYYHRIESCKVVVEASQKNKHQGNLYNVNIEINVPGKILTVNKQPDEDLYVAIRDSFQAMFRQLETFAQKQRGEVKSHFDMKRGAIDRLFVDYGFIKTPEGTEYYFHESNVQNPAFDELKIGSLVSFIEVQSGDTLQAAHVSANGKFIEDVE
jgi:ribosomal subunit interface protein